MAEEKKSSFLLNMILVSIAVIMFFTFVYFKNKSENVTGINIDGINYTLENEEAYVIYYDGINNSITIPKEITVGVSNYNVTKILDNAFKDNKKIETVILPQTINYIGNSAFENCVKLKSITIPKNVNYIGKNAYSNCSNVKSIFYNSAQEDIYIPLNGDIFNNIGANNDVSVTIGKDVLKVPDFLFASSLTGNQLHIKSFKFEGTKCTSIGDGVFSNTDITEITFPNTIFNLGKNLFRNSTVQDVTLSSNVKYIEDYMFYNCKNIQHIVIPEGVEILGIRCFAESGMISINLPESLTYIGNSAFANSKLQIINYNGSKDSWGEISVNTEKSSEFMNSKITFNGEPEEIESDIIIEENEESATEEESVEEDTSDEAAEEEQIEVEEESVPTPEPIQTPMQQQVVLPVPLPEAANTDIVTTEITATPVPEVVENMEDITGETNE